MIGDRPQAIDAQRFKSKAFQPLGRANAGCHRTRRHVTARGGRTIEARKRHRAPEGVALEAVGLIETLDPFAAPQILLYGSAPRAHHMAHVLPDRPPREFELFHSGTREFLLPANMVAHEGIDDEKPAGALIRIVQAETFLFFRPTLFGGIVNVFWRGWVEFYEKVIKCPDRVVVVVVGAVHHDLLTRRRVVFRAKAVVIVADSTLKIAHVAIAGWQQYGQRNMVQAGIATEISRCQQEIIVG